MYQELKRVRRSLWFLLGAACTVLVLFLVLVVLLAAFFAPPELKVEPGTVMAIRLGGMLGEAPATGFLEQLSGTVGNSLWDVRRALERAKDDDRIAAVKLDIGILETGWGAVAEVASCLEAFRSSGKPVYAYAASEFIGEKEYAAALGADKVWLAPGTGIFIDGLRAEVVFWRGTLDKLKIVPDLLAFKEYKSAGEPFARTKMSEYFRASLTDLLTDIQDQFIEWVANQRSMDRETVLEQINKGLLTADRARSGGWVDAVGYSDELEKELQALAGIEQYKEISHGDYLLRVEQKTGYRHKLGVVFAEGPIISSEVDELPFQTRIISGPRIAAAIDSAVKDKGVKAIILRVNSGGGSAIGSDYIWRAIDRAHEAGKPVVATMSDVAGSGGYWIAVGADKIVAQASTITGSIGVVMLKLNLRGFYELIGATVDDITLANNADMLSLFENLSEEQRALLTLWMEDVYEQFKQKVVSGRGLSLDDVERVAKGRIWTGKQALDHGLIDSLGGIKEAIAEAKKLANIPESDDVSFEIYPKPRTWFGKLFARGIPVTLPRYAVSGGLAREFAGNLTRLPEPLWWDLSTPQPLALVPSIRTR